MAKSTLVSQLRLKLAEAENLYRAEKARADGCVDEYERVKVLGADAERRCREYAQVTLDLRTRLQALEGQHKNVVDDFVNPLLRAFQLDPSTPYVKAARVIEGRMTHGVERRLFDKQGECLQAVLDAMKLMAGRKV